MIRIIRRKPIGKAAAFAIFSAFALGACDDPVRPDAADPERPGHKLPSADVTSCRAALSTGVVLCSHTVPRFL